MDARISFIVLEDTDVLRRSIVRALSAHGEVEGASTCAEARALLHRRRFDSMIADVHLPDGCGLDLVPLARRLWPGIWILVLTGSIDHSVISRTHELGVRYLLKPFDPHQLKVHVDETRARRNAGDLRVSSAIDRWTRGHGLSSAEVELLALGVRGVPRDEFALIRGVRPDTIRKQIQSLIHKTGTQTFESAVNILLREAVADPD